MNQRLIASLGAVASLALVLSGCAGGTDDTSSETTEAATAEESATAEETALVCEGSFAVMAPLTGGAASIGQEQMNFARLAAEDFNSANGSSYTLVESDTQLDAGQASTQASSIVSDSAILGVVGPAGSQEVSAVGPAFADAGIAYVSASATNSDLTNGDNPGFFRVIPTDAAQGPTVGGFITDEIGASNVVILQEKTDYGVGLSQSVADALEASGASVEVIAVPEEKKSYDDIVSKIGDDVEVVFVTFQIAAKSEQVAQSLIKADKNAVVFGSDGSFSADFKTPGSYVAAFAPDVTQVPAAADVAGRFTEQYGEFGTFGPPVYVATQSIMQAAQAACEAGSLDRAGVLTEMSNVVITDSILGGDIEFTETGDVDGARFYIFMVDEAGSPQLVQ